MTKSNLWHQRESSTLLPLWQGLLIGLLIALLSSCSSSIHRDGPPNFYVDETKIPDAVPKPEPLAKTGNNPSYVVFGRRYYTMHSSKNYDEIGVASWYGTQFHSHSTSSGERYSVLGMTAAHKTLPLPTYVEVTNLKNHRHVIVKVNDRGPFATNRIIDLSYVAAKKLHMLGHGTALVRVRAIDPYTYGQRVQLANRSQTPLNLADRYPTVSKKHAPIASQQPSGLYLQVGAFRDHARAIQLQHRLMAHLSIPVSIIQTGHHHLFRVQIGPFNNMTTAQKTGWQLKQMGIQSHRIAGA